MDGHKVPAGYLTRDLVGLDGTLLSAWYMQGIDFRPNPLI